MCWTKKVPKEPGYYWARKPRTRSIVYGGSLTPVEKPFIVYVHQDGEATVCGNDMTFRPRYGEYWWWGEIVLPPNTGPQSA